MSNGADWLIFGVSAPGVCAVIAARNLDSLHMRSSGAYSLSTGDQYNSHRVDAQFPEYVRAEGPDYQTALARLFESWTPEPEQKAIES